MFCQPTNLDKVGDGELLVQSSAEVRRLSSRKRTDDVCQRLPALGPQISCGQYGRAGTAVSVPHSHGGSGRRMDQGF